MIQAPILEVSHDLHLALWALLGSNQRPLPCRAKSAGCKTAGRRGNDLPHQPKRMLNVSDWLPLVDFRSSRLDFLIGGCGGGAEHLGA